MEARRLLRVLIIALRIRVTTPRNEAMRPLPKTPRAGIIPFNRRRGGRIGEEVDVCHVRFTSYGRASPAPALGNDLSDEKRLCKARGRIALDAT